MNTHYTYLITLFFSLLGPALMSFDKKIKFFKKWKYLSVSIILIAIFFTIWDIYFTKIGIWGFNEKYILGLKVFGLPIEEIIFFFVIPYSCVFIYECVKYYLPLIKRNASTEISFQIFAIVILIIGIMFYKRRYSSWTFILNGIFILSIYISKTKYKGFHAVYFLISYLIIILPFLIVNGVLTKLPVVFYNNSENLGLRINSIPVEDIFYGMLLILMNIVVFEKLQNSKFI